MSLGPCLLAAGVYGLVVSLVRKPCVVAEQISRASFCVFLVHIFFLHFFADKGVTALAGPAGVRLRRLCAAAADPGGAQLADMRR